VAIAGRRDRRRKVGLRTEWLLCDRGERYSFTEGVLRLARVCGKSGSGFPSHQKFKSSSPFLVFAGILFVLVGSSSLRPIYFSVVVAKKVFYHAQNYISVFEEEVIFRWLDVDVVRSSWAANLQTEKRIANRFG
jgi:hypothetical protein